MSEVYYLPYHMGDVTGWSVIDITDGMVLWYHIFLLYRHHKGFVFEKSKQDKR